MKPLAQEEDVLVLHEYGGKKRYLYVYQTEEVSYVDRTNWRTTNAVATNTLGTSVQMSDLEPKKTPAPEHEIYQLRMGVKGYGLVYAEIMAGTHRRGTWNAPRPVSSNYYIGHIDDMSSPAEDPRFECWLKWNQYPAFSVYNNYYIRKAEVELHFIGKKLRCYDMEEMVKGNVTQCGMTAEEATNLLARVKARAVPYRAITVGGLES